MGAGQDPGQLCYIAAMIVTSHLQFVKRTLAAVALLMAAAAPATPQAGDLRGNYNPKSGLITVSIESGIDIKVVTTDAVPGKSVPTDAPSAAARIAGMAERVPVRRYAPTT